MAEARTDLLPRLPASLLRAAGSLRAAGGRTWLVGGTVRDLLLGETPRDYDLATDLPPTAVHAALPAADLRDARLGTCRLALEFGEMTITTLRAESDYVDHRRPRQVTFLDDPAADALRRDFTVNALYLDLADGVLTDPVGGLADLRAGRLATVGDATVRFCEDALRMLRLLRFHARLGFAIDSATAAAAERRAGDLRLLAPERVFDELTRTFTGPGRGQAVRALVGLGFADVLLPEVASMRDVPQPPEYHPEGDVLTHVGLVLDHVPEGDATLSWAALLHDVGKPPTFRIAQDRIRFDGHDTLSATMADAVLRRFSAPRDLREAVVDICRDHIRIASLPGMRPSRREAWLRTPRFRQHLAFHRADCLGSHGNLDIWHFACRELAALPPVQPVLVTGEDVLRLGVAPGPLVGRLLAAVHAAAEEAAVPMDRGAALVLLRDMVDRHRQDGVPDSR